MRRSGLASFFVAATLVFAGACKDDPEPTQIDVEIFSTVAQLSRIHLKVRTQTLGADGRYVWAETDVDSGDVAARDLTTRPALLRLKQTRELEGIPFLLYAEGFADGVTAPVAAAAITLQYEANRTVNKRLTLDREFFAADKDHDGFPACGSYPLKSDPLELGVLPPGRTCDCNDVTDTVNPFTDEVCGNFADDNCTGWPYDENCEDCVVGQPQPCTNLSPDRWLLAGVGQCELGERACVAVTQPDGTTRNRYSDTCVFKGDNGGLPDPQETLGDLVDNDCDGIVDEGSSCSYDPAGPNVRDCFLGHVDQEARDLAKGRCGVGQQFCLPNGTWENFECRGERRPQRPPADNAQQSTVCPELWTGIGFVELEIVARDAECNASIMCNPNLDGTMVSLCVALDQCNGADDDCDGFYDEEVSFDRDGDGYTRCGSIVDTPLPSPIRNHTQPGTNDIYTDCNDNDSNVNPGEKELCTTADVDDDCKCDRGPNLGAPSVRGCAPGVPVLVCDETGGYQGDVPFGECDATGSPYWAGFAIAGDTAYCFPCRAKYGRTCDNNSGTCAAANIDCLSCGSIDTGNTAGDATHAAASRRPFCAQHREGTCTGSTGVVWDKAPVRNSGPESNDDNRDDCGQVGCGGYWDRKDGATGNCFAKADAPASAVYCNSRPLCTAAPDGSCCDGSTGANCCQVASEVCPLQGSAPTAAAIRPVCQQFPGPCTGTDGPGTPTNLPDNTDAFNECGDLDCRSVYAGTTGTAAQWNVVCNQRTTLPGSAHNCLGGACAPANTTTCAAAPTQQHPRPTCQYVTAGCTGTTGPTYSFIPSGQDPFNECAGADVCDGAGGCKKPLGTACSPGECASGNCVDGVCCNSACNGACQACNTPAASGQCVGITAQNDGSCNGVCTRCENGSCNPYPAVGPFPEVTGCSTCNGTATPVPAANGATPTGCNGANQFCCGGSCAIGGGAFNTACGTGDCESTWSCNGTGARCGSGATCGTCTGDTVNFGRCSAAGSCMNESNTDCPTCQRCNDSTPGAPSCDTTGVGYDGRVDNIEPNLCDSGGTQICDLGVCRGSKGPGVACGGGAECASGNCVDGVCCGSASCGTCQTCNGSAPGTCTPVNGAADPGTCDGTGQFCCSGTCVTPSGSTGFGTSCGSGDCAGTWACSGTNGQCSTAGTACNGSCSGDTASNFTCNGTGSCGTTATTTSCAACNQCTDGGRTASCTPYVRMDNGQLFDTTNPNQCTGAQACAENSSGVCLKSLREMCAADDECATNICRSCGGSTRCRAPSGHACAEDFDCQSCNCTGAGTCQ